MKYVAFLDPNESLDGLDWVYNLIENPKDGHLGSYDFFLVEAKSPEIVREKVADFLYNKAILNGGTEFIIEDAFGALCGLEYEDDKELFEFFGEKDGNIVLEFYEKYTWDAFIDGKISFYDTFSQEDRKKFYNFDKIILEKLYKSSIKYNILVAPITKELK